MKGKNKGVQARILRTNSRAFFMPCGCHSLNLVVGDNVSCSIESKNFFGTIQRIYESKNCWTLAYRKKTCKIFNC